MSSCPTVISSGSPPNLVTHLIAVLSVRVVRAQLLHALHGLCPCRFESKLLRFDTFAVAWGAKRALAPPASMARRVHIPRSRNKHVHGQHLPRRHGDRLFASTTTFPTLVPLRPPRQPLWSPWDNSEDYFWRFLGWSLCCWTENLGLHTRHASSKPCLC